MPHQIKEPPKRRLGTGTFDDYFCGVGCEGALGVFTPCMIELEVALRRLAKNVSDMEVSMKMMAHQVVKRERAVAVPRGPKAVWLPMPPNVAAISALLPCWSNTTTIRIMQTITWTTVIRAVIISVQ